MSYHNIKRKRKWEVKKNLINEILKLQAIAQCISIPYNANIALSTKRSHKYHSVQGLQFITVSIIVTANCFIYILPYIGIFLVNCSF